jgi:hypothetical protein
MLLVDGSVTALVANLLHPRIDDPSDTEAFLTAALWGPWRALHATLGLAILAVVTGLLLTGRLFGDQLSALLHKLSSACVAVGGLMFVILLDAIDGVGFSELAQRWAAAPADERDALEAASEALEHVNWGLIATATYLVFGLGIGFYGLAVLVGSTVPRTLGFLGLAAGFTGGVGGAVLSSRGRRPGRPGRRSSA